ncbi:hypothetical protein [Lysinibacillus composti]|uniref:hypothetical protein n=1 Tax=Lysinibacillus composti TaxID=720633 RepID=UPI00195FB39C|nr:hypothetical protein [Lysinibacillus composti]
MKKITTVNKARKSEQEIAKYFIGFDFFDKRSSCLRTIPINKEKININNKFICMPPWTI